MAVPFQAKNNLQTIEFSQKQLVERRKEKGSSLSRS